MWGPRPDYGRLGGGENRWPTKAERLDAEVRRDLFIFFSYWGDFSWLTLRHESKNLPYSDEYLTHILMNFGPQLMQDPIKALKGTSRSSAMFKVG